MKCNLVSDIHTEFWNGKDVLDPGTGEVLILAGDIGVVNTLGTEEGEPYERFLKKASEGYDKVFYVLGNHEFYHGCFVGTPQALKEFVKPYKNVSVLDNTSEFYNGVHFVGGTMWSNFENMNQEVMTKCHERMNDYFCIANLNTTLRPSDVLLRHKDTTEWFEQCLGSLRGDVVMITHHAPSYQSVQEPFDIEGAYYTDMSSLIQRHPKITHWCHGHLHGSNDYNILNTRIVSNAFGYNNYRTNELFNNGFSINV